MRQRDSLCGGLVDAMGRPITYLRVSVTQRCNLRCSYCYGSAETTPSTDSELSLAEIIRLVKAMSLLGIAKVRFTGGEPTVRPDIVELVRQAAAVDGISHVGLTTNGLTVEKVLPELVDAGLNCLNISLDTLNRDTFLKITGVDGFERVHSAIMSAEKAGAFERVKVNTVVVRGVNDIEIGRFTLWALSRNIDLRFIEFMPVRGSGWDKDLFVSEEEIRNRTGLKLEPLPAPAGGSSGPAASYHVPGKPGRISFISAVSRCFCLECNRLRVTARGELVGCLFSGATADLRHLLGGSEDIEAVAGRIRRIVAQPGFRRFPQETSVIGFNPLMRKVGG